VASILPSPGPAGLVLRSAAEIVLLGATFFAAGRRAAGRLSFSCPAEELGLSLAFGAGICGTSVFLLAAAGLLTRTAVVVLAGAIQAAAVPVWRDVLTRARRGGFRIARSAGPLLFLLLFAVPSFCLALYPPSGFDESLYHLPIARSLATTHSVGFLTNLRNPVFPELVESLDAAMILLFGGGATNLVECLALAAIGLVLAGFARRWGSPAAGALAAAFFAAHLQVVWLGGESYVDLDLTLFFVTACFAWEAWRETGEGRWLAVSGALAGFAAGTKYLGLAVLPALVVFTLARADGRRFRNAAVLSGIGMAVLSPWYFWIVSQTGNPIFPLLPGIFGHSEWEKSDVMFHGYGFPWSALMLLRQSVQGGLRGTLAGASVLVSPLWPVEVLLAGTGALLAARTRRILCIALAYGALFLANDLRFLFPALALLAFASALGLESLRREEDLPRIAVARALFAAALAGLMVLPAFSVVAGNLRALGPVPTSRDARSLFLRRTVSGYGAVEWLNQRDGDRYSVYFLRGENLAGFALGNFIGDWRGPARYEKIFPLRTRPRKLFRTLRALGADYLSTTVPIAATIPADADFRRHFRQVYFDGNWVVWRLGDF
jgi:hypothetical protein